jgi:hypothetical protein
MSGVKIKIPNIGMVEAENAASEDTLKQILVAVQKSEATKRKEEKANNEALKKQQKEAEDAAKDWEKSLEGMTEEEKKALKEAKKRAAEKTAMFSQAKTGVTSAVASLASAFGSVALSAISVATAFLTTYDDMRADPIGQAAKLVNDEITAANTAVHGVTGAVAGFASAFGPAGAIAGQIAAGIINTISDGLSEAAKLANEQMAKELKKSTQALTDYNKMNASFAGGMAEMRKTANDAGLSMTTLAAAAKGSADEFAKAGLTHGDGVKELARGMGGLTKTIGKSGANVRDEMTAMGLSYEEQGEVMAQYMAQQKAAGKDIKNMLPEDLARGTREYATNLKVLSDITGQDAKKLQDKARMESMRGALMGKLDEKQQKAYKDSYATMMAMGPEMGPKLQQALTQVMAGGPVTDPIIAGNADIMAMIKQTAGQVTEGNANMIDQTQKNLSDTTAAINAHGETATDQAVLFGKNVDGTVAGIAAMTNAFRAFKLDPDAAKNSRESSEAQAKLAGQSGTAENGLAKLKDTTESLSAEMEKLTGSKLGDYATGLADNFKKASDTVMQAIHADARSTGSKLADTGMKAAEYGAMGAAVGTVIPGVGTAIGGGIGALYGAYKGWSGMAEGGWASGDPNGFLEKLHGTELVVPTSGGMLDTNSKGYEELVKAIGGGGNNNSGSSGLADIAGSVGGAFSSMLSGVTDMMGGKSNDELTKKIDELITTLSKHTEVAQTKTDKATDSTDLADMFNGLQDVMAKHLDVSQAMASHMKDNKDITKKLLDATL